MACCCMVCAGPWGLGGLLAISGKSTAVAAVTVAPAAAAAADQPVVTEQSRLHFVLTSLTGQHCMPQTIQCQA